MTEHVHEWEYAWVDSPEHHRFVCRCGEFLEDSEVERRLNATQRLGAKQARLIVPRVPPEGVTTSELRDAMIGQRAYADILEGK